MDARPAHFFHIGKKTTIRGAHDDEGAPALLEAGPTGGAPRSSHVTVQGVVATPRAAVEHVVDRHRTTRLAETFRDGTLETSD